MSFLPADSVTLIAEYIGIPKLSEEVGKHLAPDVEYRIRDIIDTAFKFMRHSKRRILSPSDINAALRLRNVEPIYGFDTQPRMRFRRVGTSEVFFLEDREVDFSFVQENPLPRVPLDVCISAHWLAVEGVQPKIPENPKISSSVDIVSKKKQRIGERAKELEPVVLVKPGEFVKISEELEKYFDDIIKVICRNSSATRSDGTSSVLTKEVFDSLRLDAGIQPLVPYFVQFIADEISTQISNLPMLKNLLAMATALFSNAHLHIELYLHQLMPAVLTLLVGKTLCSDQLIDDHWSLRNDAAILVSRICSKYGPAYGTLLPRVTKTLSHAFLDPHRPFSTRYGAIVGLSELGPNIFYMLVLPNVELYFQLLDPEMSSPDPIRRLEANRCYSALLVAVGRFLVNKSSDYDQLSYHEKISKLATSPPNQQEEEKKNPSQAVFSDMTEKYDSVFNIFGDKLVPYLQCSGIFQSVL